MKFYFYIKYINKASAGGIRSMCKFSDTHMYVCRTQTHRQAYTPHNINQNDGSCSHLGMNTDWVLPAPVPTSNTGHMIIRSTAAV